GKYHSMWRKQVRAQRAAEEAKVLKDKAERLRRESRSGEVPQEGDNSAGSSEDEKERQRSAQKSQNMQAPVDAGEAPTELARQQEGSTKPPGHP
ncbi:hypothetical protein KCU77_g15079, partial [Aureobasidium melanogenum]